jgi:hypothetical protein
MVVESVWDLAWRLLRRCCCLLRWVAAHGLADAVYSGLTGSCAVKLLQQIPLDAALRARCDEGKPLMSSRRETGRPAWQAYMKVAERVSQLLTATPCTSSGPKISMS